MRVSKAMSPDVRVATPGQSISDAAKVMAEIDAGSFAGGRKRPADRHDHRPRYCDSRRCGAARARTPRSVR